MCSDILVSLKGSTTGHLVWKHVRCNITIFPFADLVDSADGHRKKKLTVKDVFNDDEDGVDENKKKRPLVPLGNYISFQSGEKLTECS